MLVYEVGPYGMLDHMSIVGALPPCMDINIYETYMGILHEKQRRNKKYYL